MSNKKHNESLITDEQTLMRRAWVDLALNSVRSQLNFEALESADTVAAGYETADEGANSVSRRPNLYLAYSASRRRSEISS